ncbi:MAG: c-type cytochrome [Acidobacteriaceae bacterium]
MQIENRRNTALWTAICVAGTLMVGCSAPAPAAPRADKPAPIAAASIPSGAEGDLVHRGKLIFDQTPKYASAYVGNRLSCSDCHLKSGTANYSAPMIDLANLFPMYNKRAGRVISMQERFQECFTRSENGSPPPLDSPEMKALTAYVDWLSRDGVKGKPYAGRGLVKIADLKGNAKKGKILYADQCAVCHGADGAGIPPVMPPVWGPTSYNDGAGMDVPKKAAAFLIHNMPQDHPASLAAQDAYDVAEFLHAMPRPKFNTAYKVY